MSEGEPIDPKLNRPFSEQLVLSLGGPYLLVCNEFLLRMFAVDRSQTTLTVIRERSVPLVVDRNGELRIFGGKDTSEPNFTFNLVGLRRASTTLYIGNNYRLFFNRVTGALSSYNLSSTSRIFYQEQAITKGLEALAQAYQQPHPTPA